MVAVLRRQKQATLMAYQRFGMHVSGLSRAAFWCTPQDAYSQSHWYENQDASDNEQDQIHYSHVIHLITTPPCLGFSS